MLCSIGNTVAVNPVFGATTGLVYERSTIEKALLASSRCPVTNLELSLKDLLPMRLPNSSALGSTNVQPPRSLDAASIPSLLQSFQNEWDAMALEVFTLKQQLEKTRRELAVALYQNDAAARVIQRITAERDEARRGEAPAPASAPSPAARPARVTVHALSPNEVEVITEQDASMQQERKAKRKQMKQSEPKFSMSAPREVCRDAACFDVSENGLLAWASSNSSNAGQVHLASLTNSSSTASTIQLDATTAGALRMQQIKFIPNKDLLLGVVENSSALHFFSSSSVLGSVALQSAVVDACAHTKSGDYSFALDASGTWSFLRNELMQVAVQANAGAGATSIAAHPDGKLFAVGTQAEDIQIWDVLSGKKVGAISTHGRGVVQRQLGLAENGTSLACLTNKSMVEVWDMRKADAAVQVFGGENGAATCFAFGHDASALAVGFNTGSFQVYALTPRKGETSLPLCFSAPTPLPGRIASMALTSRALYTQTNQGVVSEWGKE